MEESEQQAIIDALYNLPVCVSITRRNDRYVWQCMEGNGTALTLDKAISQSLHYLIGRIGNPRYIPTRAGRKGRIAGQSHM